MEKIEVIGKHWCIYRGILFFPQGIGKIEEESDTTVRVRYSEGQLYLPEAWNKKYIERFETIEEAIEKFTNDTGDQSGLRVAMENFPTAFKKEDFA